MRYVPLTHNFFHGKPDVDRWGLQGRATRHPKRHRDRHDRVTRGAFHLIQQRDRAGPCRVRVCACGKRDETVNGLGSGEAVFGIGVRVDGRPVVCAGNVDRGECIL
jgi:hypothetical protein